MGMREKLIQILSVPIYQHELADPTEVVADYLLDNDVVPVVRCKDCHNCTKSKWCNLLMMDVKDDMFCSNGKRKDHGDG